MASGKRRLCIVNPSQHGGGAEYQINCLVDILRQTGRYDIYYLARYLDDKAAGGRYTVVQIGNGGGVPFIGYMRDYFSLMAALEACRPDVIYQRVACAYTGICARYAKKQGTQMVWHVAHESDVIPDPSFYGTRNKLRSWLEKGSVEYGLRRATQIVTQTQAQARLLEENYGRRADAIIANFHPDPVEALDKSGPTTVAWVANLKPIKRPDAFVRLAQALRDLPDVRFVMAGPASFGSDEAYGKALMDAIAATPNLTYVGPATQEEVYRLLATSHLFVNTSVQEGFPNTFIQSWMRAVPVVSLSVNPDDVLDREQVGIFGRTEQGLAEAARKLLTDSSLRAKYAARARDYSMAQHSTRNAQRLEQLLATGKVPPATAPPSVAQS